MSDDLDITNTQFMCNVQRKQSALTNDSEPNKCILSIFFLFCIYLNRVQCAHSKTKLCVLKLYARQLDDPSVLYTNRWVFTIECYAHAIMRRVQIQMITEKPSTALTHRPTHSQTLAKNGIDPTLCMYFIQCFKNKPSDRPNNRENIEIIMQLLFCCKWKSIQKKIILFSFLWFNFACIQCQCLENERRVREADCRRLCNFNEFDT